MNYNSRQNGRRKTIIQTRQRANIINKVKKRQRKQQEKLTIYKQPGRFAPDRLRVRLIYQDPTGSRSTTGSSPSINWRYRSSAYDPDPALLTGSLPGYAELSNLYTFYCVHAMDANIQVANQDTQAYIIVVWPSNNDNNSNSLAPVDIAEYSGNVLAKSQILGGTSGFNIATLNTKAQGEQLVGSRFRTDLDYSSSTSTNPVALYYLNVAAYSPLGNMAYPLVTKCRIIYDIEFFRLRQLET